MSEADTDTAWEGYSDYRTVSQAIARSIDEALEAYAGLDSLHAESARVQPEQAAQARASILSAALRLVPELEADKDTNDEYEKILNDWQGEADDEDGYIDQLDEVRLQQTCPAWLYDMVLQIRSAGWHLGYLQAGRRVQDDPDPDERQAKSMFE